MKSLKKLGIFVVAAALSLPTWCRNFGASSTYSDLVWTFSSSVSGLPSCVQLYSDISGDFAYSSRFAMYGVLNCPAQDIGYAVTGTAYFGTNGLFNVNAVIGGYWQVNCPNMNNFAGTCTVKNGAGLSLGSAFVSMV